MVGTTKRGIILMNLGSPDSPEVKDVRKYLIEFLMDKRVINMPVLYRTLLVKGIIANFRSSKSAEAYKSIWTKEGSPLISNTFKLQKALKNRIDEPVEIAMRYGNPDMKTAYDNLLKQNPNIEEIVLLPLYPHYASSSYETAVEHAKDVYKTNNYKFKIKVVKPFYNDLGYIKALSESLRQYVNSDCHILFSYHSIPESHIIKSDLSGNHCLKTEDCCITNSSSHKYCYRHQCFETTKLVTELLGISKDRYSVAFQSKLGRAKWLQPSTTETVKQFAKMDITHKNLVVVCPAFVSDCLETLEEIAIREKKNFMDAGGESYTFVPCLNNNKEWVDAVVSLINN